MKRVKVFSVVACLLVTMVSLSSVAFSLEGFGLGSYFYFSCPLCGNYGWFKVTSYRQPSFGSSGYISILCPSCSQTYSRSTRFWSSVSTVDLSTAGFFDELSVSCSVTGKIERGILFFMTLPTCTSYAYVQFNHMGFSCNTSTSESFRSLGHSYLETSRTPATCTTPGFILSTCTRCEGTKKESIPIVPHTWTETSRTPVSCVSGTINYTCSVCSQTKTEPLPADPSAHTWAETSRTPATCLPGSIEYTCSTCHDTKTESIPALENAHTYDIAEIVPAEYDSGGNLLTASYIRYACSACGDSYNSTIGGNISGPIINEGEGGNSMGDATAALGKTFLSGLWALFGIYVPGFSFTFGQMWLGVLLASISILVVRMMFGFGGSGSGGVSSRTGSTSNPKISKERRYDEF